MENEIKTQQRESIKLMKMSKGYNWEIRVLPVGEGSKDLLTEKDVIRLEALNLLLINKFKGEAKE